MVLPQCPVDPVGPLLPLSICWLHAAVNVAGQYYTVTSGWDFTTIDQVLCPENTYSPGLKKQRAW